jgi:hypothetical protein
VSIAESVLQASSLVYLLTASKPGETTALEAVVDELTGVFSSFHGREVGWNGNHNQGCSSVCSNEVDTCIRWCKGVPAVSSWLQA